ncbi:MAG: YlmH/Sll1252 family protein [Megasphaera sp.]|nr:YlmH/Sll1252 family protein [Megasphaera sp.]MCH4218498.1 YlmH/Sll1252 family protein [Megasphaera sp.]
MKNRDRIIRYYKGTDNGELAARLIDLADSAAKGRPYAVSEFVSPGAVQIGETIQAHVPSLVLKSFGGYEGAERVKLAFVNADYEGLVEYGITACRASWDARYRLLGHRDVLGSLMGLGIDRTHFGDIIMTESSAVILADTSLYAYVQQNFTKIAMVPVTIDEIPLGDIAPRQEKVKEIKTTVASLRLDAIASSGFGMSRTKAAEAIKGERVQVNWQPAKGPSQDVAAGDVISLRGKGRMELVSITGTSRKGRIGVLLKRYM